MLTGEYEKTADMTENITEISEAVRLHRIEEEKFNTNFISVVWTMPAERKRATKTALLAECLRLGPGGDRRKLDEKLAEMYGAVFEIAVIQKGGRQLLALNMEVVKDENAGEKVLKNAAGLMREIINGRISDTAFKQAAGRLRDSLAERDDTAAVYAVESLMDMVYPNDPFSIHCGGYEEDIDSIGLRDINDLFLHIKSSGHTDIFITGSVDEYAALEMARSFISRRGNVSPLPVDKAEPAGGCAEKSEKRNIGQSRIAAAYTLELEPRGKDYYTALILRNILCGAGSSILYDSVRQEEGLCYYIGAKLMRFRMVYVIDCGVAPGNEEKTVKLMDQGINGCCVDEKLFEAAKRSVLRETKAAGDRRSGAVNKRMNEMLLGITQAEDEEKLIGSVTLEDVKKAAAGLKKKGVFIVEAEKRENGGDGYGREA